MTALLWLLGFAAYVALACLVGAFLGRLNPAAAVADPGIDTGSDSTIS